LPNIEEILKDWYDVDSMEEVIKRFQKEEDLEATRRNLELEAQESFQNFKYK
jgi:hypothetical protein